MLKLSQLYASAYLLGATLFFLAVAVGIVQSLSSGGSLPSIESTFDTYIEELLRTEDYDRAGREIRMALTQYGSNLHMVHNSLGRVLAIQASRLAMQGQRQEALVKFREAEAEFQNALRRKPDYPDAYQNLGTLYLNLGALQQSETCFQRALELAPDFAVAHHNLGHLYARQGDLQRALTHFEQAVRLEPGSEVMRRDLERARKLRASGSQRPL